MLDNSTLWMGLTTLGLGLAGWLLAVIRTKAAVTKAVNEEKLKSVQESQAQTIEDIKYAKPIDETKGKRSDSKLNADLADAEWLRKSDD